MSARLPIFRSPGILLVLTATALVGGTWVRAGAPPELMVALAEKKSEIILGSTAGFELLDPEGRLVKSLEGRKRVRIRVKPKRSSSVPADGVPRLKLTVRPRKGSYLTLDGRAYRGTFQIKEDTKKRILLVNVVDVESYLYSVVAAEMGGKVEREALKAQAVASRSYALRNRDVFEGRGYGLKAGEQSQVYKGLEGETPETRAAVEATRGLVLMHDGQPIKAVFHASCGGRTESNEDVWDGKPLTYLRSVKCNWCRSHDNYNWNASLSLETVGKRLSLAKPGLGRVRDVTFRYSKTGRVKSVKIHTSKGTALVGGNTFRLLVDRRKLRSMRLRRVGGTRASRSSRRASITAGLGGRGVGERLMVRGTGFGHGVGMCQWGAQAQAKKGRSYEKILRYYFSGARLRRLY